MVFHIFSDLDLLKLYTFSDMNYDIYSSFYHNRIQFTGKYPLYKAKKRLTELNSSIRLIFLCDYRFIQRIVYANSFRVLVIEQPFSNAL